MTQDFIFILPAGKERILREIELLTTFGGREGGVLRRKGIIGVDHIGGRALNIISNLNFYYSRTYSDDHPIQVRIGLEPFKMTFADPCNLRISTLVTVVLKLGANGYSPK